LGLALMDFASALDETGRPPKISAVIERLRQDAQLREEREAQAVVADGEAVGRRYSDADKPVPA
jgi:hypothetical protein